MGKAQKKAPDPKSEQAEKDRILWLAFVKKPTDDLRNQLIMRYQMNVKYIAERIYNRLPDEVELDDLIQAGNFGLRDAISGFDLNRGIKFETYCASRVRGAILDELRSMDWVPRLVRARSHRVDQAAKQLEMEMGHKPTEEEIYNHLGLKGDEMAKIRRDSTPVTAVSLSRKWFETDGNKEVREIDVLHDADSPPPGEEVDLKDLQVVLFKGLSRAERLIMSLYYYESMTMREIGIALDLSESRVSQMHSSIIDRMRANFGSKYEAIFGLEKRVA